MPSDSHRARRRRRRSDAASAAADPSAAVHRPDGVLLDPGPRDPRTRRCRRGGRRREPHVPRWDRPGGVVRRTGRRASCVRATPRPASSMPEARPPLLAFPSRPVQFQELPRTLEHAIADRRAGREPQPVPSSGDELTGILAESRAMRGVMGLIDRAALRDTPILLVGESGTGKELLARALHRKSPRAAGPFLAVNCSAIPETLLESELFGHRRGAFTDARDDQRGLFQSAQRGTVFLDEIGDMAPALQGKLLRVLQEKEVHPLGAPGPVPTDVRIVTATHRDLDVPGRRTGAFARTCCIGSTSSRCGCRRCGNGRTIWGRWSGTFSTSTARRSAVESARCLRT